MTKNINQSPHAGSRSEATLNASPSTSSQSTLKNGWTAAALGLAVACLVLLLVLYLPTAGAQTEGENPATPARAFNGDRAYDALKKICKIGPRISGSDGMVRQQKMLKNYFEGIGGEVEMQSFVVRSPQDGSDVPMSNLIVRWHPDKQRRVLLCAHYDTRPFPDQDPNPRKRKDPFIGANDGASGTALLVELGRYMKDLDKDFGVDFVLFDGEEFVFRDKDKYFLGSTYFAEEYASSQKADEPPFRYLCGVLFDMVGDKSLQIYQEQHSVRWAETKPVVDDIWKTAARLGIREFIPIPRYEIKDDHLPIRNIGRIPCCDIIDFDYPHPNSRKSYWHTTHDTADKCSGRSLGKVGTVALEWLRQLRFVEN